MDTKIPSDLYSISLPDIEGNLVSMSAYQGYVIIFVNVASECGFTSQYADLQHIYEKYKDKGLRILAFPCNDFGKQEPGDHASIKAFCDKHFGVAFPLFSKIHVRGPEMHGLYRYLTNKSHHQVRWNFQKFIANRKGEVYWSVAPHVSILTDEVVHLIESLLADQAA